VEGQLEALPHEVIRRAMAFNESLQYLLEPETVTVSKESLPSSLKRLMDDVAGVERLGDRIKQEILKDEDARQVKILHSP
jgi:hypothetical protein